MTVSFAWTKYAGFPTRFTLMIRAIWIKLGLKTQPRAQGIRLPPRTSQSSVQVVTAVKLDSWLIGIQFEHSPACGIFQSCRMSQVLFGWRNHPSVVVSFSNNELSMVSLDSCADQCGVPKIKRGATNMLKRSGDIRGIRGYNGTTRQGQKVIQNGWVALPRKVEVCMIGQVYHGGFISNRLDLYT